jgi:aminoglycoside 2'-N-acetyltransferase I
VPQIRALPTEELTREEAIAVWELLGAAWEDEDERFTEEDWQHAVGGVHFILEDAGDVVAHASVVDRELHTQGRRLRTGYVEAVATRAQHRGRGLGTALMKEVTGYVDRVFELGALATGRTMFYERLRWVVWRGPTFVRTDRGPVPTEDEDGSVMVHLTPASPSLDLTAPISCEWRPGDVW